MEGDTETGEKNGHGKKEKAGRKNQQTKLPGTERTLKIKPLEKLATTYQAAKETRMDATRKEVTAKQALMAEMQKHEDKLKQADGTLLYMCDEEELNVTLEPTDFELKVKRRSTEKE